ncbi:MAG: HlyD family efflux transporter periplasmic adaptor subunit [Acidobacteriota bacterium]
MDVPRKSGARKKLIRRIIYGTITLAVVAAITVVVARLEPAVMSVDAGTLYMDTVKRGEMRRQERGLGTLVPEDIRWIPAITQGKVEKVNVKPGAEVTPDTILVEMSNPEAERDAIDAEAQLRASQADLKALEVRLQSQLLDQRATAATVKADYVSAKYQAEVNEELVKKQLIGELQYKLSKVRADELEQRNAIEESRLAILAESSRAQIAAQKARVDQLQATLDLRRSQIAALKVRAGMTGVVQLVQAQVGQQVSPGANLARVADPTRLKAEIRIAETRTKDLAIGQSVQIDTRNGIIPGRVIRIDPAAQNGTVAVDVSLEGELPKGARPDMSVDGTIELERLENILYVSRPVHGSENATVGLFRVDPDGNGAVRVQVKLGRSSVNHIEIIDGLREGDKVILSDTSAWDNADRIRLNR